MWCKECLSRRTSVVLRLFYLKAPSFLACCPTNALQTRASSPNSQTASCGTRSPLRCGCFLKIFVNATNLWKMDTLFLVVVYFGLWLAGSDHCEGGSSFHWGLRRCTHARADGLHPPSFSIWGESFFAWVLDVQSPVACSPHPVASAASPLPPQMVQVTETMTGMAWWPRTPKPSWNSCTKPPHIMVTRYFDWPVKASAPAPRAATGRPGQHSGPFQLHAHCPNSEPAERLLHPF